MDKSTGFDAENFANRLAKEGVATRPFFYPLHLQPVGEASKIKIKKYKYPVAERISKQSLYLQSGLGLKDWQIEKVCKVIRKYLG